MDSSQINNKTSFTNTEAQYKINMKKSTTIIIRDTQLHPMIWKTHEHPNACVINILDKLANDLEDRTEYDQTVL